MPTEISIGQQWAFTGPNQDESPTLTICRIDLDSHHGRIVFVIIDGTWTPILYSGQRGPSLFACTEACIRSSINYLISDSAIVPDIQTAYDYFSAEYTAHNVGLFESPLATYLAFYRNVRDARES